MSFQRAMKMKMKGTMRIDPSEMVPAGDKDGLPEI